MIELRLLGGLELRRGGGLKLDGLLTQPKRVALLAFLAAATPPRFHRRDTLLGLFWPELDQEHARAALRQALHGLRQGLGAEVLTSRGDEEVSVDEQRLSCDVRAFHQALEAEDWTRALELYRGGLLEGFFLSDTPEFERWLEEERGHLRDRACQAAWTLAQRARVECDAALAAQWARRAASLLPDDEEMVRRLIAFLDEMGDRVGAMRVYEEFAGRAASEYQVDPAAETKALMALVRSRETASAPGPTRTQAPIVAPRPPPVPSTESAPRRFGIPSERWVAVGIGLLLLGGVIAIKHPQPDARLSRASVGIPERTTLPPDPVAYDLFSRGRYEASRRTAASLSRAVAFFSQSIRRDSAFAPGWAALAAVLHNANRWGFPVRGVPRESLLTREIMASDRALQLDSTGVEAWLTRASASEDVDPTSRGPALRAIRRALALDSLNAVAWDQLAMALEEAGHRDSAGAAWHRAVALDPGYVRAKTFLAIHYWWWRAYDSAAVWADSAVATDPLYGLGRVVAGQVALARGRRDEAQSQLAAAGRLPTGPGSAGLSGFVSLAVAAGDTVAARHLVAEAEARTDPAAPDNHSAVNIAAAYAVLGEADRALMWLERYRPVRDLHFQLHLRLDPPLDPLRREPRFQALLLKGP